MLFRSTGGKLTARVRYHGTIAEILADYNTDLELWQDQAVSVTDETGETYPRCNLLDMRKTTRPQGFPLEGTQKAFMDAEIQFTRDA